MTRWATFRHSEEHWVEAQAPSARLLLRRRDGRSSAREFEVLLSALCTQLRDLLVFQRPLQNEYVSHPPHELLSGQHRGRPPVVAHPQFIEREDGPAWTDAIATNFLAIEIQPHKTLVVRHGIMVVRIRVDFEVSSRSDVCTVDNRAQTLEVVVAAAIGVEEHIVGRDFGGYGSLTAEHPSES